MAKTVLFSNYTIVTPHQEGPVTISENAFCVVSGKKITYVGTDKDEAERNASKNGEGDYYTYEGKNKILCPTFANAHGHTPMSIFRNIADDFSLQNWLFGEIIPREDRMISDDFYYGNLLTLAEMIEGGTGCVANMYDGAFEICKGSLESGFRIQQTVMGKKCQDGVWSVDKAGVEEFLDYLKTNDSEGLLKPSLLVHSIYLYPEDFYSPLNELALEYKIPVSVHISETLTELENCEKSYGCSPVKKLDSFGMLTDTTVAAHCVHLSEEDRAILSQRKVWVAHNPSSNMKLASGMANMVAMQKDGIRLCLGTDGAASNNNQDMFMEMRLASFMAKGTTLDPTVLKAEDVFTMATRNGYQACGFYDAGVIEEGMLADLQIIDYDCPQMWPLGNPLSALIYSCGPKCVESTMINGQFVMFKHELKTIDLEKVKAETAKTMQRLK